MTWRTAAAILAATAGTGGLAGAATTAWSHEQRTQQCARVAFTAHSEDVASRIRASGLTCGLARDLIRDSEGAPGPRFRGFDCRSTAVDRPDGLPYRRFRCTGGGDTVTWRRF